MSSTMLTVVNRRLGVFIRNSCVHYSEQTASCAVRATASSVTKPAPETQSWYGLNKSVVK